ncbi:uncharacterized protein SAPINGB_P003347 [Magnusiomyces paraingens]|uniref:U1 small nuclear ribonucleoprotein component SNU71 n=1 Tax=Magnusiomyces paraingens TaxID=2606893 RepID=A0A5E8BUD3_9ASCO|nr:uncharacterized protein SAPINGB_P003347 [Saprochaete ingens]VVT52987.1 unnamed protein product [Saprochaete ingens]
MYRSYGTHQRNYSQIPLYSNSNSNQQYQISRNLDQDFKIPSYGQLPPNPLAKNANNSSGLSNGLINDSLRQFRPPVFKSISRNQPQQQQQKQAGSANLHNNSNNNTNVLILVKTLHPMTNEQQLRTVFVSKIPELMNETSIINIFQLIPTFETFIRLLNGRSEPLSYGFVRFQNIDAIKFFIDVFESIDYKKSTYNTFDTLFSISTDENTLKYLEQRTLEKNGLESYFMGKNVKEVASIVEMKIKNWYEITSATFGDDLSIKIQRKDDDEDKKESSEDNNITKPEDVTINESEFDDLEIDDKETILQEIREFRLLSIKFEKVKQDQSAEEKKERDKYLEKETSKMLGDKSDGDLNKKSDDDGKLFTERDFREMSDSEDEIPESDERLEEIRQSRLRQKEERVFEEDQRRWIGRERIRSSALAREKEREEDFEARLERERRKALKQYAEFVDGGEYEKNKMEYYYNHATWVKNRMSARLREQAQDEQDAEDEAEEERQKMEEKNNFMSSLASELSTKKSGAGKFKLSLSGAKKTSQASEAVTNALGKEEDSRAVSDKKPKKVLISVNYETLKDIDDFISSSSNDPSITSLVNEIPKIPEDLFKFKISWEFLTNDIIEDKLKPFITSLIMEYLGVQEDELISFVVSLLKEHKEPQNFVKEMEIALDEDAIVFIKQLWRLLIFETERLHREI